MNDNLGPLIHVRDVPIGALCRRPSGTKNFRIVGVRRHGCEDRDVYTCRYEDCNVETTLKEVYVIQEGENEMTKTLFQIKGEETYGYKLATNSQGKIVFEVKGTAEIRTVDKDQVEEVMPYTIGIKFLDGGSSSIEYSYFNEARNLKVGDLLIVDSTSSLSKVTAVDTKSRKATKEIKGFKVQAEVI